MGRGELGWAGLGWGLTFMKECIHRVLVLWRSVFALRAAAQYKTVQQPFSRLPWHEQTTGTTTKPVSREKSALTTAYTK